MAGCYKCKAGGLTGYEFLTVWPVPLLTLTPIRRTVGCEAGRLSVVYVTCCAQGPFRDPSWDPTPLLLVNSTLIKDRFLPGTGARGYISLAYGARLK